MDAPHRKDAKTDSANTDNRQLPLLLALDWRMVLGKRIFARDSHVLGIGGAIQHASAVFAFLGYGKD